MKSIIPIVFFFSLCSLNAIAQTPSTAGQVSTDVLPNAVAVTTWATNATFKYGILDAFSGKLGFYVQADVTPLAALELGLGLTRKNLLMEAATGSEDNNGYFLSTFNSPYWQGDNRRDLEEFFYDYDFRKVKTGSYISLTPRVQFGSSSSFMSSFIGCRFEYRRYNWTADGVKSGDELIYDSSVQFKEMERQLNILFIYGGYYKLGSLIFESYIGVGTRYFYMKKRDIGFEYVGPLQTKEYGAVLTTWRKTSAMVELGINIGLSTAK